MALFKKEPGKTPPEGKAKSPLPGKKAPGKGKRQPKKGLRSRMPVKRSINLILVDENKISFTKAVPGIILIVLLAGAFSKFMVADRLVAMSQASGRANSIKSTLEDTTEALNRFEGVEDTYAHMTYAGMTAEELDRVDRVKVLELVATILPEGDTAKSWDLTGNILTVEITGSSLQSLNELAKQIEESPIVDSCVIATAKKDEMKTLGTLPGSDNSNKSLASALESRRQMVENGVVDSMLSAMNQSQQELDEEVQGRFTIYLRQPPETPEETPEPSAESIEPSGEDAEVPAETAQPSEEDAEAPAETAQPSEDGEAELSEDVQTTTEPEEVDAP